MIRVVLSYLVVGFLVSTRGQFAYTFERDPHVQSDRPMSRAGGIGEEKPADDESKDIATKVREDTEDKVGKKFDEFEAVKYTTQVVAGINYFIKVRVGNDEYIHIRVFRSLQQEYSLASYQLDKALDDPITYF